MTVNMHHSGTPPTVPRARHQDELRRTAMTIEASNGEIDVRPKAWA